MVSETKKPNLNQEHPWPGLSAFQESDRAYFFGREVEIAEMVRIIRNEPLTVLFGKSGIGKSSLLRAGLFPELRDENLYPIFLRIRYEEGLPSPDEQIRQAIKAQLKAAGVEMTDIDDPRFPTLWEYFHHDDTEFWNHRNQWVTPVLIFDQFEELFSIGYGNAGQQTKARELCEILESLASSKIPASVQRRMEADADYADRFEIRKLPLKLVISIREDFLADLSDLQLDWQIAISNRYRLQPLAGNRAMEAVTGPGKGLIDEAVAQELILAVSQSHRRSRIRRFLSQDDPLTHRQVEPALLSVFCRELNNERLARNSQKITLEQVRASTESILNQFFQRTISQSPENLRDYLENKLVTEQGYRSRSPLTEALALDGIQEEQVQLLVDQRLIRIEEDNGILWIELTHDILTGVIQQSRQTRKAQREAEARLRTWKRRIRNTVCITAAVYLIGVISYIIFLARDVPLMAEVEQLKFPEPTEEELASHALLMWFSGHPEYGRLDEFPDDLELRNSLQYLTEDSGEFLKAIRENPTTIRNEWESMEVGRAWLEKTAAYSSLADLTDSFEYELPFFSKLSDFAHYLFAVSILDLEAGKPDVALERILKLTEAVEKIALGSRTLIASVISQELMRKCVTVLDLILDTYSTRYSKQELQTIRRSLDNMGDPYEHFRRGLIGENILMIRELDKIAGMDMATLFALSGNSFSNNDLLSVVSRFFPRLFYKPNLSLNTHFQFLKHQLDYADQFINQMNPGGQAASRIVMMNPLGLADDLQPPDFEEIMRQSGNRWGKNLIGQILFRIGLPSIERYLIQVRDLKIKIEQFEQRINREFPEMPAESES